MQSNDGQIIRAAALESLGILIQPNYIIHDDVVAGRLVPVLDEWDLPRLTISIAYQGRKRRRGSGCSSISWCGISRKWTMSASGQVDVGRQTPTNTDW
jgi:DNA-binding transcriptional LysR family regulator